MSLSEVIINFTVKIDEANLALCNLNRQMNNMFVKVDFSEGTAIHKEQDFEKYLSGYRTINIKEIKKI